MKKKRNILYAPKTGIQTLDLHLFIRIETLIKAKDHRLASLNTKFEYKCSIFFLFFKFQFNMNE